MLYESDIFSYKHMTTRLYLGVQAWYEDRRYSEHVIVVSDFFGRVVPHWPD